MQIRENIYRSFFSLLCCMPLYGHGAVTSDSLSRDTTVVVSMPEPDKHQLRFGADLSKPIGNLLNHTRYGYEFLLDYYYKKELYFVLEAGWGGADIAYPDLWYMSRNVFFKAGVDKNMIPRLFPSDPDMLFVGFRYGIGLISRGEAGFVTDDNFWGQTTGTVPAKNQTAHWGELTAGIRVELWKGVFTGYNVRARFLMNQQAFRELPPAYIAGYGKGEKTLTFDFSFYLLYALRW